MSQMSPKILAQLYEATKKIANMPTEEWNRIRIEVCSEIFTDQIEEAAGARWAEDSSLDPSRHIRYHG